MQETSKIPPKVIAAIVVTGLMSFCGVIVETAMNISFPKLMTEFNVTTNVVQWMTSIYLLVVAIIVPLSARLKKGFPTKKIFITANLLFIVGVSIDICAPDFPLLLLGRAIQGGWHRDCTALNVQHYYGTSTKSEDRDDDGLW